MISVQGEGSDQQPGEGEVLRCAVPRESGEGSFHLRHEPVYAAGYRIGFVRSELAPLEALTVYEQGSEALVSSEPDGVNLDSSPSAPGFDTSVVGCSVCNDHRDTGGELGPIRERLEGRGLPEPGVYRQAGGSLCQCLDGCQEGPG